MLSLHALFFSQHAPWALWAHCNLQENPLPPDRKTGKLSPNGWIFCAGFTRKFSSWRRDLRSLIFQERISALSSDTMKIQRKETDFRNLGFFHLHGSGSEEVLCHNSLMSMTMAVLPRGWSVSTIHILLNWSLSSKTARPTKRKVKRKQYTARHFKNSEMHSRIRIHFHLMVSALPKNGRRYAGLSVFEKTS